MVTDVIRTDDDDKFGGIIFVVQENCFPFPFKLIGISLLFEQGIVKLHHLKEDLQLPRGEIFDSMSPDETFAILGGRNGLRRPDEPRIEKEDYNKRGGWHQRLQYAFSNNPNKLPPWHSSFYPESDENVPPEDGV